MDRYGLLTIAQRAGMAQVARAAAMAQSRRTWSLAHQLIIRPEMRCPFCLQLVRSNAVWVADNATHYLIGQFRLEPGGRARPSAPEHPNANQAGKVCYGTAKDMVSALTGVNLRDAAYGDSWVRAWLQRWFDHTCHRPDAGAPQGNLMHEVRAAASRRST